MTRASKDGKLVPKEGLIHVSFNFDGKQYKRSHQLSQFELATLKEMLATHGEQTANTVISKAAIQNTAILAENVLAVAFLEYINRHHKVVEVEQAEPITMVQAIEQMKKESNDEAN